MKLFVVVSSLLSLTAARVISRTVDYSNFTVALVRAPPANYPYPPPSESWQGQTYDLNTTVDLGIRYIKQAALNGANLVAFPELWFPGYLFDGPAGPNEQLTYYLEQALVVGSAQWDRLVAAAREYHVWLEFGFSQRDGDHVFMAQALFDDSGEVIQLRQKLRPSGGERTVFSDGTIDELKVFQTPFGRLGMLECWEHMHPTMTIPVQAQNENLHIAAFPWAPDLGAMTGLTSTEVSLAGARYYAVTGQTYVLMPAVGTAVVIHPNGTIVAQLNASDCPLAQPLLYYSLNTTGFAGTLDININGEFSWAALQQINDAYPSYIPHEQGTFIPRRLISVEEMKKSGPIPVNY
ncbi:nitrilase [Colletotrichum liriopes]|uniref:nitrilase n=1 Tax=Colletotrichum liriopes TaxID=708192 RepID=A0AA37H0J1_9PEZI|nr:nitrilase [Colletotrichum liriopes]